MLVIFPKAGDYSGQVLPDHVAVHVQDLLRQQEQLIVTLGVLQTLEILPGRLPEGRVVPGAGRLLDRGVEPGAGPALVELGGVGVGVGSPGHADRPHHGDLPSHIPVLTCLVNTPSPSPALSSVTVNTLPEHWGMEHQPRMSHCALSSLDQGPPPTACVLVHPVSLYAVHTATTVQLYSTVHCTDCCWLLGYNGHSSSLCRTRLLQRCRTLVDTGHWYRPLILVA